MIRGTTVAPAGDFEMRVAPSPAEIRELVSRIVLGLGFPEPTSDKLRETILLDMGKYLGRSYRTNDFMAMWLIDVGILQFYDADGNMLQTVNLFEEREPQGMAA